MALLFIDGFDAYGNTNNAAPTTDVVGNKYVLLDSGLKVQVGRNGTGHSLEISGTTTRLVKADLDTTNATMVIGFGMYIDSIANSLTPVWLKTNDTWGINLIVNTDGTITIKNNVTTLATTANTVVTASTWRYYELEVVCGNSGSYELWVDGVSELSGTGDTQAHTSKSYHNVVQFRRQTFAAVGLTRFDDLYILDGTGATNNARLGDMEITTIYPDGDDTTQWTANSGGTHFSEVDEVELDTTTYIEANTSAKQDIFTFGGLASSAAISGVQTTVDCVETEAQSYQLKMLSKNSTPTTETAAAQFVGSTDYLSKCAIFETDPDGSVWTQSTVNSNKFGVEIA